MKFLPTFFIALLQGTNYICSMKKLLLWLFALLMAVGCQRHHDYPLVLQEADSLCVAQPDSAVALLQTISADMQL